MLVNQCCYLVKCDVCDTYIMQRDKPVHYDTMTEAMVGLGAESWVMWPDGKVICSDTDESHERIRRLAADNLGGVQ
jgi:hypothetical protein